jgi:hypothetical protein
MQLIVPGWPCLPCLVLQVGGNGGNAGANAIQQKCDEADVLCNVIGVPKSIDNDILLIDKCFGFDTAVEEAQRALLAAKVEASSARRGVGLVKLMGRQSGFIAMQASMASGEGRGGAGWVGGWVSHGCRRSVCFLYVQHRHLQHPVCFCLHLTTVTRLVRRGCSGRVTHF